MGLFRQLPAVIAPGLVTVTQVMAGIVVNYKYRVSYGRRIANLQSLAARSYLAAMAGGVRIDDFICLRAERT